MCVCVYVCVCLCVCVFEIVILCGTATKLSAQILGGKKNSALESVWYTIFTVTVTTVNIIIIIINVSTNILLRVPY